ncbi:MAG TPA: DNA mismatch repair endonuclease MutL [Ktedonobacteraceae bacterium]|nr:DNA mismatch repair endonuclease MutL [Ktedonobacteraceae bacterium]
MPIRQLEPDVAAKIAAGEVVERPASVVKELIENSIDAGATQIRVDLMNGGLQLIRVTDNGSGIPGDELQLAVARHATSKVARIDDLEHIRSLGFRGEALASIAAVAEVTLVSHHRDAAQGAQVHAINGQISDVSTAASPGGSTVTVRNLFSAVPARLKFLKSRHTEVSHCHHLLEQYALAYPEIRFSVSSEGRQIFSTPGDGQLPSVLLEIYGLQVAEQMVPISSLDGKDEDPERPLVSGYISLPTCYKSTRQYLSFFVNRRWVLSRMLSYAFEEAYHSLLLTGRHPLAVVNIMVDPTQIDVNVHPAKTEIRFLKERRVYAAVQRAVRQAILEDAQMPAWGNDKVVNKQIVANRTPAADGNMSTEAVELDFEIEEEDVEAQSAFSSNGVEAALYPKDNPWMTVTEEETGTKPPLLSRLWQSHVRGHDEEARDADSIGSTSWIDSNRTPDNRTSDNRTPDNRTPARGVPTFQDVGSEDGDVEDLPEPHEIASEVRALPNLSSKSGESTMPAKVSRLPRLRVVGQLSQSYIVTEGPDGMYLIDQHAAHERILLEKMVTALQERAPLSQMLLTPITLTLAPDELEAIEDHLQQLEQIGFTLEILEDSSLQVRAVPNVLVKEMNARSLHDLLVELTVTDQPGHSETWEEHALANVACKAAIKANYFLTVSEMREMIEQLERTNAPYSCCHGRPTMVHFSLSALEREFGRR